MLGFVARQIFFEFSLELLIKDISNHEYMINKVISNLVKWYLTDREAVVLGMEYPIEHHQSSLRQVGDCSRIGSKVIYVGHAFHIQFLVIHLE